MVKIYKFYSYIKNIKKKNLRYLNGQENRLILWSIILSTTSHFLPIINNFNNFDNILN